MSDYSRVKELVHLGYKSCGRASPPPFCRMRSTIRRSGRNIWPPVRRANTGRLTRWKPSKSLGADRRHGSPGIQNRLSKALRGPLDLSKVDTQLTRIAGEGQFDRLGYEGFTPEWSSRFARHHTRKVLWPAVCRSRRQRRRLRRGGIRFFRGRASDFHGCCPPRRRMAQRSAVRIQQSGGQRVLPAFGPVAVFRCAVRISHPSLRATPSAD